MAATGSPWISSAILYANANGQFSDGAAADDNFMFNPAAFANPAAGKFGNLTRNTLRNPGDQQWDLAIFKNFALGGTQKLQFRAEMFNFINHPNLSGPNSGHHQPRLRPRRGTRTATAATSSWRCATCSKPRITRIHTRRSRGSEHDNRTPGGH